MIKRIISICLCAFLMFSSVSIIASADTNYENVKIEYKRADSTIAISGNVKSVSDSTEAVRLMVLKPQTDVDKLISGEISFVQQGVYAAEAVLTDKVFTFATFKLKDNSPAGEYIVRIAFDGEVYTKTLDVASVAQTVEFMKNAADIDAVKEYIEMYNDVYGLDVDEDSLIASFETEDQNWVYSNMLNVNYQTTSDVYKQFTNYTNLKKIALGPWGVVNDIISANAVLLGLDLTVYNTLTSAEKDRVCKELSGTLYNTPEQLNSALSELSKNPPASTTGPTGGTGGGGGGGGGNKNTTSNVSWVGESVNTPDADDTEKVAFSDLANHQWAVESINELYAKGIINGKAEGVFAPEDKLTRAEAIKMIVLAFGGVDNTAECDFTDVDESSWMYTFIATAYKRGIINGYNDGTSGANNNITREDFSVMIMRAAEAAEVELYEKVEAISFNDTQDISGYASDAVKKLQTAGIINGMEDNTFMPKAPTTRAQAAKIIAGLV